MSRFGTLSFPQGSRWALLGCVAGAMFVSLLAGAAQTPSGRPPGTTYKSPAFNFVKIQDGIYHAVGTGSLVVMSNAAIFETDRSVLVVDSHVTPGGAWALREELKTITPKPIRYVVNSHHHFDHSHGNQIYGPDVEIVGTEFAREQILAGKSVNARPYEWFVGGVPGQIAQLEKRLAEATDSAEKERLQGQLAVQRNHLEGTKAVKPTPPTITLVDRMTLHHGGREIRILFLGRGHTGGDLVVYLPKERVVATGDLLVESISYSGEAYLPDWIDTLEKLKGLDFDTVLPGHGNAFKGKAKVEHFQAYLRTLFTESKRMHDAGVPMEEASKQIDLRTHVANYPSLKTVGIVPPHGVWRVYELLDGKVK